MMLLVFYFWVMHALMLSLNRYNAPITGLVIVLILTSIAEMQRQGRTFTR